MEKQINNHRSKRILITGVAGFIPSNLAESLIQQGHTVIGIDNFLTGNFNNIKSFKESDSFYFVRGDVNNFESLYKIFYSFHPEIVYHYAACVGVKRTLEHPDWVLKDLKGFENLLELSRDFNVERILFSSSSEVYGEPVEFPQLEDTTPLNSKLPYAVVKNLGEVYLKTYKNLHDLNYTIFRFFNTYGPRQSEDFVISKFINQSLTNKQITIYGDGSQTRTFCFIDDNVQATINAIYSLKSQNEIYNVGSDNEVSILEIAKMIKELTNSKSKIVHLDPLEEGDMTRRKPDVRKMKKELLEKEDLISLSEGLLKTINFFKTNRQ